MPVRQSEGEREIDRQREKNEIDREREKIDKGLQTTVTIASKKVNRREKERERERER